MPKMKLLNWIYYIGSAVNLNKPMGERKKAVEGLKSNILHTFKNISDESILAGKAADSYQRLSNAILASAKARAVQDRLVEQAKQKLDLEDQLAEKEEKRAKLESARDQMKAQYESSQRRLWIQLETCMGS